LGQDAQDQYRERGDPDMKTLKTMTEPELYDLMNTICRGIEMIADKMDVEKPLFCLVLFNDPEVAQYAGNCQRSDMITAMRETADRLERNETVDR
jgi:hypothetical protein